MNKSIKKGQVVWCMLDGDGSEQQGLRPCVVVQNNTGNRFSPTTIVVPLTTRNNSKMLPTHLSIKSCEAGLGLDSTVLTEQIRIIDKKKIRSATKYKLSPYLIAEIDRKILISLGISS